MDGSQQTLFGSPSERRENVVQDRYSVQSPEHPSQNYGPPQFQAAPECHPENPHRHTSPGCGAAKEACMIPQWLGIRTGKLANSDRCKAECKGGSICSGLMVGSITTQDPPRNSPPGGMYTKTGLLYSTSASTICAPNFKTSWYMSRVPPKGMQKSTHTHTQKKKKRILVSCMRPTTSVCML